jgi:hypothetical protein
VSGRPAGAMLAAGLAGLLAGSVLTLAIQGGAMPLDDPGPPRAVPAPTRPEPPDTLLAWTPGRIPEGFGRGVARLPGVRHVVVVASGIGWLSSSRSAEGSLVDRAPAGYSIPLEVAAVDPLAYRPFLPGADQRLVVDLERGAVVLGASSAALRGLGPGATLRFGTVRARVAGVLPDELVGAHEVLASRALAERLGVNRDRYALLDPRPETPTRRIASSLRGLLAPGTPLRVRAPGETPYFRQGDAVLPPIKLKELLGEFAARPAGEGWLDIDPAWTRAHIVTREVPVLGRVSCNRIVMPQVVGALRELAVEGLGHLVDPADYGGCYAPRFLSRDPGAGLSHHAWGAAVDVNVSANAFGRVPHQDPRVVEAFERWGFTWGGRWLIPDGMHFDFVRLALTAS